nr:hypothetical protein [Zoogloeaceae bacterium]
MDKTVMQILLVAGPVLSLIGSLLALKRFARRDEKYPRTRRGKSWSTHE